MVGSSSKSCNKVVTMLFVAALAVTLAMLCVPPEAHARNAGEIVAATKAGATQADISNKAIVIYNKSSHVGGAEFIKWNYGTMASRESWCVDFVSYVANEAGLIAEGRYPNPALRKTGTGAHWAATCNVDALRGWYKANPSKGRIFKNDGTYIPVAGDIAMRNGEHVGIVVRYEDENRYWTIEGNVHNADNSKSSIGYKLYSITDKNAWSDFVHVTCKQGRNDLLNISNATFSGVKAVHDATGFDIKPSGTLRMGGVTLKQGSDYIIYYSNCRYVGTASCRPCGFSEIYNAGRIYTTFKSKKFAQQQKYKINGVPVYQYWGTGRATGLSFYSKSPSSSKIFNYSVKRSSTVFYGVKTGIAVNAYYHALRGVHYTSNAAIAKHLTNNGFVSRGVQFYGTRNTDLNTYRLKHIVKANYAKLGSAEQATHWYVGVSHHFNESKYKTVYANFKNKYGNPAVYDVWSPVGWK